MGIKPASARQDFRRITVVSGLQEKTCQSMFRHRFVTNMVKLHLIAFMDKNPLKSRQLMIESDYRTILKKVATFTGHQDPDSLNSYIDLAWEEINIFSDVYDIKKLSDRLASINHYLNSLKTDVAGINRLTSKKSIKYLNDKID